MLYLFLFKDIQSLLVVVVLELLDMDLELVVLIQFFQQSHLLVEEEEHSVAVLFPVELVVQVVQLEDLMVRLLVVLSELLVILLP
tara:strand:+ start:90 stop:344 length:255 start_codon:yes stop_codon:yes gene_type:complete